MISRKDLYSGSESVSVSVSVSEKKTAKTFGYEQLDVYRISLQSEANLLLDRIVAMLTKLGQRGYTVREELSDYSANKIDSDSDSDDPSRP